MFSQKVCGLLRCRFRWRQPTFRFCSWDNGLIVSYLVQIDAEHIAEDGFARKESVACLLDIISMWIVVNIVCNFVDTWQGMKNLHVGLCQFQHIVVEDIYILH